MEKVDVEQVRKSAMGLRSFFHFFFFPIFPELNKITENKRCWVWGGGAVKKCAPPGRVVSCPGSVSKGVIPAGLVSARRALWIYICRKWWRLVSPALTSSLTWASR